MARYEWGQGADGAFYWRLIATNGRIVGQGEGYKSRAGVLRGIDAHRRHAATARVVERRG